MSAEQVLAGGVDLLEVGDEVLVAQVFGLFLQHLAVADDGVERRAQLVGHVGQELATCAAGGLELLTLVLELAEQPGVLDGENRLGGEGLQQTRPPWRELPGGLPQHHEAAEMCSSRKHGNGQDGSESVLGQEGAQSLRVRAQSGNVGNLDGLAGYGRLPERALAQSNRTRPERRR